MISIEDMIEEHNNIKRMLVVIRKYSYKVLRNESIEYRDFYKIIDFVRNYADKHHDGKEEVILLDKMMKELGTTAQKLIRHGMFVEHDLGRLYIQWLEEAVEKAMKGEDNARLDIIANAISYTHLLYRHIDKGDNVVYTYAQNNLKKESLHQINEESKEFENNAKERKIQEKYLEIIKELEEKL